MAVAIKIDELMYYGRYYSSESEGYHIWWFDTEKATVRQYDELLEEFGYCSWEEILSSGYFIPLFETDIVELEREFILNTQGHAIAGQFETVSDSDYDTEFKIYIERNHLSKIWYEFERERLYKDAVDWCKANKLKFD